MAEKREKKKFNLSMPPELAQMFDRLASGYGKKRRWIACASSVYLWLKATQTEKDRLEDLMMKADSRAAEMERLLHELPASVRFTDSITAPQVPAIPPPNKPEIPPPRSQSRDAKRSNRGRAK